MVLKHNIAILILTRHQDKVNHTCNSLFITKDLRIKSAHQLLYVQFRNLISNIFDRSATFLYRVKQ